MTCKMILGFASYSCLQSFQKYHSQSVGHSLDSSLSIQEKGQTWAQCGALLTDDGVSWEEQLISGCSFPL